ncbi:hypothetical protein V6N12_027348 [Hibiscus sabdariffa]|uniref:RNase H type-1 domain-containing protein n=1 Tax=Hibiscus sabdariffa TaxID=183260 RepID=A0ABR2DW04_9ROSI
MWVTLHDCNLTNYERFRRYLTPSMVCDICGSSVENMDHILRHCIAACGLWCRVILPELLEEFMLAPFDVWCSAILASDHTSREDILARGNRLVDECVQVLSNKPYHSVPEALPDQLWSRPAPGWVKGNVDATVHIGNGQAAIGGLIRDEHGEWIVGFTRPVGRCPVLIVELWALHDMLARAWSFGFRRIVVEMDCLEVIRILQRAFHTRSLEMVWLYLLDIGRNKTGSW